MKKLISFLLAALLTFSFCGCVNQEKNTSDADETESISLEENRASDSFSDTENTSDALVELSTEEAFETSAALVPVTEYEEPQTAEEKTAKKAEAETENATKSLPSSTEIKEKESEDFTSEGTSREETLTEESESAEESEITEEPILTEPAVQVCYITVKCDTLLNNMSSLKTEKQSFIPSDGVILNITEIPVTDGMTAFDVLKKACSSNRCSDNCAFCQKGGIQLEYNFTPAFGNYYIEGIHQLYEKDCGSLSGWMYSVNGAFPSVGLSSYEVSAGDEIAILYTCNMGEDIGNIF